MPGILDCHIHCSDNKDDILISYAKENGLKYNSKELLSMMEENEVELGLLLSPPLNDGRPLPNKEIIALTQKSRDRLFPIVTVEPSNKSVDGCIELARKNKGYVKGFKILLGYFPVYPDAKIYARIYEYAEKHELPVMFHTGDTATRDGSLEHAKPLRLDIVANRWKFLKMVICHFGNPWFSDTAELLYKHPNVYADISGLFCSGARYSESYLQYLSRALSDAIYFVGRSDKILFGTDYPIEKYPDAIQLVRSLDVRKDDIQNILTSNARSVYSF